MNGNLFELIIVKQKQTNERKPNNSDWSVKHECDKFSEWAHYHPSNIYKLLTVCSGSELTCYHFDLILFSQSHSLVKIGCFY